MRRKDITFTEIALGDIKMFNRQDYLSSINTFLASGDFCRLLITFANSLDPDQARQNVGPDLDPNCLTL